MPIAHVPATQALETSGNISRSVWGGLLRAHNLLVGLIMLCYVALGVEYSVVVPLWENPDEPEHMLYVRYVATHQSPPAAELEGQFTSNDEGGQAPLYYALAAMLVSRIDMSDLDRMHINPYRTWPGHPASHAMFEHTQDEVGPWREVVLAAHIVRLLSVASQIRG